MFAAMVWRPFQLNSGIVRAFLPQKTIPFLNHFSHSPTGPKRTYSIGEPRANLGSFATLIALQHVSPRFRSPANTRGGEKNRAFLIGSIGQISRRRSKGPPSWPASK